MRQRRIALHSRLGRSAILSISPLAIINGVPVYPICGAENDGTGGDGKKPDDDKNAGGNSGSGSADDDDDEDGDSGERPPKDPKQYQAWLKVQQLSRENANRRAKNKDLADQIKAQQDELDKIKSRDMSDLQKAQSTAAKAEKERDDLQSRVEGMQVELAFLKLPRDKHDWHDPGAALTLLMAEHRDALTLSDDGTVDGLEDAVKALAKKHKFLIKPASSSNGNGSTGGSFSGGNDKNQQGAEKAVDRFRL